MNQIPLTQGKIALVDDEDYEWLSRWNWYAVRMRKHHWYAARKVGPYDDRRTVLMHRQILPVLFGIDHIDGNGLNNQKGNLRWATTRENAQNSKRSPGVVSPYKGVRMYPKHPSWGFTARITVNGKRIHLGTFETAEEAALAYNEASIKYFGEFASPNKGGG